jgi:hypothetical protein
LSNFLNNVPDHADPADDFSLFESQFQQYQRRIGRQPYASRQLRDELIYADLLSDDGSLEFRWLKDRNDQSAKNIDPDDGSLRPQ